MKLEEKNWQNNFNKVEHEINQATFAVREQRIKCKEKEQEIKLSDLKIKELKLIASMPKKKERPPKQLESISSMEHLDQSTEMVDLPPVPSQTRFKQNKISFVGNVNRETHSKSELGGAQFKEVNINSKDEVNL